MSTPFYDLASLVLVPSGYKASKVYAQKPLTTDGQLTFSRASTATRVNASGLIETVSSNVPRLDYLGSTCPKILLEPSRTNLATSSEDLTGAGWSFQGTTVSSNATTAPDGLTTADAIVETATTDEHNRIAGVSLTAASYTASIFLKKFNQTWCALYLYNGTVGIRHWINLDTLTAGTSANIGAGITAPLTLTNYGNGWVRASMTWTANATSWSFYIGCARSNGGATTYAGDGTSGVYAWGAQVEAGAYATSYVKTEAAAVTRLADACSKTGITSLIGQSAGTLFLDFQYNQPSPDVNGRLLQVYATNDTTNAIVPLIFGEGANVNRFQLTTFSAGGTAVAITASAATVVPFGRQKFAIAYNAGAYTVYRNGSLFASGSGLVPASLTAMDLGGSSSATRNLGNPINQALLFKTRLTNAQLAELTAL